MTSPASTPIALVKVEEVRITPTGPALVFTCADCDQKAIVDVNDEHAARDADLGNQTVVFLVPMKDSCRDALVVIPTSLVRSIRTFGAEKQEW